MTDGPAPGNGGDDGALLFVDSGNHSIKWSLDRSGKHEAMHRGTIEELAAFLATVSGRIIQGYLSSVNAPRSVGSLRTLMTQHCSAVHPVQIAEGTDSLKLCYKEPHKLGVDRWLSLLGALEFAPCLVVDSGTALTVDRIITSNQGFYHTGGWIIPGFKAMARNLFAATEIERSEIGMNSAIWGMSTHTCISCGLSQSQIGIVHHAAALTSLPIVLTGGGACFLYQHLDRRRRVVWIKDLVIRGMRLYHRRLSSE